MAIIGRLVLDALALEGLLPPAARIADLGSGAGFPGLPLAIVRPEAHFVLVEARERRHHFQRTAIRELGLENVDPRRGRIEQLEPASAEGVVAQAVAKPRGAVELAIPWCESGGWIAVPGSESPPDPGELDQIRIANTFAYHVPCGGPSRSLWLGRRA